jgi:hypothetical protein
MIEMHARITWFEKIVLLFIPGKWIETSEGRLYVKIFRDKLYLLKEDIFKHTRDHKNNDSGHGIWEKKK